MELREQAIHLARSMLAAVPSNNIYSYADNLFDLKEMRLGDPALAKQVDFLKNTTLSQVDFEDLEDPALFTLKNQETAETIKVSNRESSRGEIRGHVLRLILEQERKKHPSKSLFDVISEALKDPQYSDMIVMMRGALTGDVVKPLYNGESMTKAHFDAFQNAVLSAIKQKIETGEIPADLDPIDIRRNDEVRERVTSGIDFGALYDLSQLMPKLSRHIEQLEEKAEHLRVRGYKHEADLAQTLAKNLSGEQDKLMRGKSSPQEFVNHTKAQINEAKDAGLGNLRGVGRVFFPILNGILNVLTSVCTLGLANIATGRLSIFSKSSDAGQKIEKIEQEIGENTLGKTGP